MKSADLVKKKKKEGGVKNRRSCIRPARDYTSAYALHCAACIWFALRCFAVDSIFTGENILIQANAISRLDAYIKDSSKAL